MVGRASAGGALLRDASAARRLERRSNFPSIHVRCTHCWVNGLALTALPDPLPQRSLLGVEREASRRHLPNRLYGEG